VLTRRDFQGLCGFAPTTAARQIKRLKEEEKKLKNINTYYNPIYVPMPGYYGKAEIKTDE
ncbi:MAG: DNA-binding protein, partial [Bacteroides xylanisolvens]